MSRDRHVALFVDALETGTGRIDLASAGGEPTVVSGSVLRSALLSTHHSTDPTPLTIIGCSFEGQIDLSHMTIPIGLEFESCTFSKPLQIEGADLLFLHIRNCPRLPGLLGNGCRVRHNVVLDNTIIRARQLSLASTSHSAAVWLCEAELGGRLLIRDGSIVDGLGGRSIHADRIRVGANIRFLDNVRMIGEVRLLSAVINGSIDIVGSTFEADRSVAIELAETHIGGSLFVLEDKDMARRTKVKGTVVLSDVHIGAMLTIRGVDLDGQPGQNSDLYGRMPRHAETIAVSAPRCEVGDDLIVDSSCEIRGALLFPRSTFHGDVVLSNVEVCNSDDKSIDFGNAEISGGLLASGLQAHGEVWLAGCRIGASLVLDQAEVSRSSGEGVVATGLSVDGDIQLSKLRADEATLRFRSCRVAGDFTARAAQLHNPCDYTLILSNADIGGGVRLDGIKSDGLIAISRASVAGRMTLGQSELICQHKWDKNPRGDALEVISSTVLGGMFLDWKQADSVNFASTRTTIVADQAKNWPARSDLSGFQCERFESVSSPRSPWAITDRLNILRSQEPFDLGPYEAAATVYRSHGLLTEADLIRIEGRREAARARRTGEAKRRRLAGFFDAIYRLSVGYGFRPERALVIIAALVFAVWLSLVGPSSISNEIMRATGESGQVYSPAGRLADQEATDRCGESDVRCFAPIVYAIETVVPLVDLGQRGTWYVDTQADHGFLYQAWFTIATLTGWALSTVFLLSFSRLGRAGT